MAQTWQARSEKENFCAPYIKPICFHGDWSEFTDDFIRELMIYHKYDPDTHISCKPKKTIPSAYMVRLYVNVYFKVKPLGTCTSSSRTKIFFLNVPIDPPKVCTKFQVSSTSIS